MKNPQRTFRQSVFRFFGSVKLAMLLLAVIIIATIIGTFVESKLDTAVAQSYVYDAPWFMAWLVLLCVNLIGAVVVRYPWKPHQLGFIITHAGIVTILVGAIIGRIWGMEGNIQLFKGQPPINYLLTGQQTLQAKTAGMKESKTRVMNLSRQVPSVEEPAKLKLNDIEISAIGFAPELGLRTRVEKGDGTGRRAVRIVMNSAMTGKPFDQWLVLDDAKLGAVQFGPAMIRYRSEPNAIGEETETHSAGDAKMVSSRESHFAFARMPDMNLSRPAAGEPTGIKSSYEFVKEGAGKNYKGTLELTTASGSFTFLISDVLGKETPIKGTPWTLKLKSYFADLRMQGKTPVSVSDEPNNPAVLFEILGPLVSEVAAHHAHSPGCSHEADSYDGHDHKNHDGHRHGDHSPMTAELNLFRNSNGDLRFESKSRSHEPIQGNIKVGEEFMPGLADWKCRVEEITDHAVVRQELAALSEEASQKTGASGLLIQSKKGAQTDTRWIRMGSTTRFEFAGEKLELDFGHKLHQLDFTVQLEKFEVEMNEGTQNPGSFKSHVRFHDPKKEMTLTRAVWMNNPANFPNFAGAGLLGTAYKFSQSSWNPGNLDETTLQVIRDPGWSLKWIGSLMLCGGLFVMFYLKPYPRFAQKTASKTSTQIPPLEPVLQPQPNGFKAQPKIEEEVLAGK